MPRGKPQAAVAEFIGQLCRAPQHRRVKPSQWRYGAHVDKINLNLGVCADVQNA
ncbi:hypothetical protein D3C87_1442610 [compost metagenome]